jgi:hypothetical protein
MALFVIRLFGRFLELKKEENHSNVLLEAWQLVKWNIWVITKPPTRESDLIPVL